MAWADTEPMRWEQACELASEALRKAKLNIDAFERDAKIIAKMDAEFLEDAGGKIGVAALNRDKSPARKRAIDACQFAIQKANMYNAYATAIAAVHMQGG